MGFFSDLKEDLSQAVNELIPEEEEKAAMSPQQEAAMQRAAMQRAAMQYTTGAAAAQTEREAPAEEKTPAETIRTRENTTVRETEEMMTETMTLKDTMTEEPAGGGMADTLESLLEQIDMQEQPAAAPESKAQPVSASFLDSSLSGKSVSEEVAVVTAGMKIKGDMTSDGSMDVIGTIEGNIDILGKLNVTGTITGNSKATEIYAESAKITGEVRSEGSVKIGQSSVIIGNIFANSAVIAGAVKGDIDIHGPIILDTSAIIMGNIRSKSVQINNGAVIEGMCSQCYADINPTYFFEDFKKNNSKKSGKA